MELLNTSKQVFEWQSRAGDRRPRVATGWPSFDSLLHRGGLAPGELVILAGRTRTRKTTVALNITANLLRSGIHVGFVGLDETPASYVSKLLSVFAEIPTQELEEHWEAPHVQEALRQYQEYAKLLSMAKGSRPSMHDLTEWKQAAEYLVEEPMRVVMVDYTSLLIRDRYAGPEVQRVQRLIEDLQIWTNEQEVVTIALHQVGRYDEGTGGRYHGDTPLSLEGLKWGGEEIADLVWATYRPALDPLGHMSWSQALAWNPRLDREVWERACERVRRFEQVTYLQLLKNRPGTKVHQEGIPLVSPTEAHGMREARSDEVAEPELDEETMRLRSGLGGGAEVDVGGISEDE